MSIENLATLVGTSDLENASINRPVYTGSATGLKHVSFKEQKKNYGAKDILGQYGGDYKPQRGRHRVCILTSSKF